MGSIDSLNAKAPHASGCLVCGAPLAYQQQRAPRRCALCEVEAISDALCLDGHYVCDTCHAQTSYDLIEQTCRRVRDHDPVALAVQLMRSPQVHMHGPEHHFLVPAVLLSCFCHAAGREAELPKLLAEARRRSEAVKGGFCGFWGACGAAIGVGIFMSLVAGATPLSREEWKLANGATAKVLTRIADCGGPRCCKRDTFIALQGAVLVIRASLGVPLEAAPVACEFSAANQECLHQECAFFPKPKA